MGQVVELTVDECLSLIGTRSVGRVGLVTEAGLRIFPVNFAVSEEKIIFRTLPYGVIANSAHGAEVVDLERDLDDEGRSGWSVLAVGRCERVEDPGMVRLIRSEHDPDSWADGQRNLYFQIEWTDLTGRQVGVASRPPLVSGREPG